jgi:hypothetical protein
VLSVTATAIPEPATYAAILGACVLGLAGLVRRRRSAPALKPIDYPPPGSIKLDAWEHDLMRRSSDAGPGAG